MKKVVWTLGALVLTCGMAQAQDVNEPVPTAPAYEQAQAPAANPLDKTLIANEHKVAEALMKKDKATFTSLVDTKGWAGDGTGFTKVADFVTSFDQIVINNFKITDEKVAWVD